MKFGHHPEPERKYMTITESTTQYQHTLGENAVQFLTADGEYAPSAAAARFIGRAAKVDGDQLADFYRLMAVTRRVDRESTALQRQGQLVLWPSAEGQEAAQVGAFAALRPTDMIFPTYREHVLTMGRKVPHAQRMCFNRGTHHGGWDPNEFSMMPYTVVLSAQLLHAAGYAWGAALEQAGWTEAELAEKGQVTLACFGDGASSEGDAHEAMVYAASMDAPVVFFCQNNQWAISVPFEVQSRVPVSDRAASYGFEGIKVDGNDPLAMYAVMDYATEKTRLGRGPVLVEAMTYRLAPHTTADDPTKYRESDEESAARELDPLTRTETYLRRHFGFTDEFFDDVAAEGETESAALREAVIGLTGDNTPSLLHQLDVVYAEDNSLIDEERAELAEWLAAENS